MTRVLVCGGRDFNDDNHLVEVLNEHHRQRYFTLLIEGGASGADEAAGWWADYTGIPHMTIKADWDRLGRKAGPIRNQRMIDEGEPDLVIAFPGGRGTADMVMRARSEGIEVIEIGEEL